MPGDWKKHLLEDQGAEREVAENRLSSRGCSKFSPARPEGVGRLRRTLAVRRREARD